MCEHDGMEKLVESNLAEGTMITECTGCGANFRYSGVTMLEIVRQCDSLSDVVIEVFNATIKGGDSRVGEKPSI